MHEDDFRSAVITSLRADLALALRAAAHYGLAEGVCNHFSIELPDDSGRFLLNPRGLLWSEIGPDNIVLIDAQGRKLAGRHAVEPTAMFIHAAIHRIGRKACVPHTHMPYASALTLTVDHKRAGKVDELVFTPLELSVHCPGAARVDRAALHIGAVAFIHRFGSSLSACALPCLRG